jgi:hypothetical protein
MQDLVCKDRGKKRGNEDGRKILVHNEGEEMNR